MLVVRAIASGGKFIGDDIGGALITIRDARNGSVLAQGHTSGDSGDTQKLMKICRTRDQALPVNSTTSAFVVPLETLFGGKSPFQALPLQIECYGPLGGLQSASRVSVTQWLGPLSRGPAVPVLLEIPGLMIQIQKPATHAVDQIDQRNKRPHRLTVQANVTMMCGCPIGDMADNPWPSDDFEVQAFLSPINVVSPHFESTRLFWVNPIPSRFEGKLSLLPWIDQSSSLSSSTNNSLISLKLVVTAQQKSLPHNFGAAEVVINLSS